MIWRVECCRDNTVPLIVTTKLSGDMTELSVATLFCTVGAMLRAVVGEVKKDKCAP